MNSIKNRKSSDWSFEGPAQLSCSRGREEDEQENASYKSYNLPSNISKLMEDFTVLSYKRSVLIFLVLKCPKKLSH